ncbi:putative alkaline serine protease [Coniochaeta sp. 2T2.1]|nr:putative alkaline serine protease [Coniochaeta sp. 2T2.1]
MATVHGPVRTVPGQWIVRLKPYATSNLQAKHLSLVNERTADATSFDCKVTHQYNFDEARGYAAYFDDATKEQIEKLSEVASVEPVQLYKHCEVAVNDVPWGLARLSSYSKLAGTSGPYTYKYNEEAAGQGVVAYVLDTGINDKHVQFEGRASRGQKFVTRPRPGVITDDNDHQGHGTHCAGTIGSKDYGVAKKVSIVGIKVFNDLPPEDKMAGATTTDILAALEHVVEEYRRHGKPSVVNLSLGGGPSETLDNAITATVRAGVVVCCAAGNETSPVETTSPARSPLALTVAASGINDEIAPWSNYGALVDIIAPGMAIKSTWIGPQNNETNTISGTSMACPHVVGVAATILSNAALKSKTPFDVASELLVLADKNKIYGIDGIKGRTVDAVAHVAI